MEQSRSHHAKTAANKTTIPIHKSTYPLILEVYLSLLSVSIFHRTFVSFLLKVILYLWVIFSIHFPGFMKIRVKFVKNMVVQ